MTFSKAGVNQQQANVALDDKPALTDLTHSSVPSSSHGSQENKLEDGTFYDVAASRTTPILTGAEEKKLLRRIDWRLLPLLAAMYVVKTIDAQNVGHTSCGYGDNLGIITNEPVRSRMLAPWTKALCTTSWLNLT